MPSSLISYRIVVPFWNLVIPNFIFTCFWSSKSSPEMVVRFSLQHSRAISQSASHSSAVLPYRCSKIQQTTPPQTYFSQALLVAVAKSLTKANLWQEGFLFPHSLEECHPSWWEGMVAEMSWSYHWALSKEWGLPTFFWTSPSPLYSVWNFSPWSPPAPPPSRVILPSWLTLSGNARQELYLLGDSKF